MCHKGCTKQNNLLINSKYIKEWNYDKNIIDVNKITCGSHKIVWWKCNVCKNEWEATPLRRSQGYYNCLKCQSLGIKHSNFIQEWRDDKSIFEILPYSKIKCKWWCNKCNVVYLSAPHDKMHGNGCPYCSGAMVSDKNRFSSNYSELLKEWNYKKNNDISPDNISYGSSKTVWWKCNKCDNEWKTRLDHRTISNNGCPNCVEKKFFVPLYNKYFQSKIEIYFYNKYMDLNINFLHDQFYDLKNFGKYRYDFYLPSENKYIEVTGYYKNNCHIEWASYLRNIVVKKRYATNVLMANFEFIPYRLSKEEKEKINKMIMMT